MDRKIFRTTAVFLAAASITAVAASQVQAGGVTYGKGEKYVKIGGRIQLQYHRKDPDGGGSSDTIFFRRFRPYIEGSIHKDWKGKFQWDMGKAGGGNEVAVKDAYMQYQGLRGMKLTIGNAKTVFSREYLTSSKKQQLVERTFVGDHNYGTPDRALGVHVAGRNDGGSLTWRASFASAAIDPDAAKLDFDTPVNRDEDFNEGWLAGVRADFYPMGRFAMSQGDFNRERKAAVGVALFTWENDGDNNTRTTGGSADDPAKPDVDSVTGLEINGAYRGGGLSVDIQYNRFDAETVDSSVTEGIYRNGETTLENFAMEGGYMIVPSKFEIVAGYQVQDADNYAKRWTRTSLGANCFFEKHDIKAQLTYRMGENLKGKKGNDEDELFLQMQYVF